MRRPISKDPTASGTTLALPPAWPRAFGAAEPALCRSGALLEHRGKEEAMKLVLILAA